MPVFESQDPSAFGWLRGPAADVVPFSYGGHAFPQGVARLAAPIFTACLDRICGVPDYRLPDDLSLNGGCWGYSDRRKASGSGWSFHAYGLALDVGAPWNAMGPRTPPAGPHRLPLITGDLVRPLGVLWGGGPAGFGDWMHLEVHLTPAEAQRFSSDALPSVGQMAWPLPQGYYFGPRSGPTESVSNLYRPRAEWIAALALAQLRLGVSPDGLYGPITADAARQFQRLNGLTPDGLIGPRTWTALGL